MEDRAMAVATCVAAELNAPAMPGADIGSYSPIAAAISLWDAIGSTVRERAWNLSSSRASELAPLDASMRIGSGAVPPNAASASSGRLLPVAMRANKFRDSIGSSAKAWISSYTPPIAAPAVWPSSFVAPA
jgi:hypothetical protein